MQEYLQKQKEKVSTLIASAWTAGLADKRFTMCTLAIYLFKYDSLTRIRCSLTDHQQNPQSFDEIDKR